MRVSEIVTVSYFIYLAGVSWFRSTTPMRRWTVMALASFVIVIVLAIATMPTTPVLVGVRDWMPCVYLLTGYWVPGMLAGPINTRLEEWLLAFDRRLLRVGGDADWTSQAPRMVLEYFELAYLCCYPIVPAGLVWLYLSGFPGDADAYWTAVLVALFVCYGLVPWLPTRPPRAIEGHTAIDHRHLVIRTVNVKLLRHGSIQLNTFPSGHAAGAVTSALMVAGRDTEAGLVFVLLAISIMIGSVLGRYHYVADAIAGTLVALISFALARSLVQP